MLTESQKLEVNEIANYLRKQLLKYSKNKEIHSRVLLSAICKFTVMNIDAISEYIAKETNQDMKDITLSVKESALNWIGDAIDQILIKKTSH